MVHMTSDAPEQLMNNSWAGTAKEELRILLDSGLIPKAVVERNDISLTL